MLARLCKNALGSRFSVKFGIKFGIDRSLSSMNLCYFNKSFNCVSRKWFSTNEEKIKELEAELNKTKEKLNTTKEESQKYISKLNQKVYERWWRPHVGSFAIAAASCLATGVIIHQALV